MLASLAGITISGMSRLIVVCSALLICEGLACQRRYLSNIIVTHLDDERPHVCQEEGQHVSSFQLKLQCTVNYNLTSVYKYYHKVIPQLFRPV